jgi:hypothetical protein
MERTALQWKISELRQYFDAIEFPDYQREPNVWNLDQKQHLIDSLLRKFDIAALYMYERDDQVWECIDGRQRLNTIMSFMGANPQDGETNGFRARMDNEVGEHNEPAVRLANGKTYLDLINARTDDAEVDRLLTELDDYPVTVVTLSGARNPEEFNLQFLRLNLGALINAGEKLKAMVGEMRDVVFDGGLGRHPFLGRTAVPTRRFGHEQIAAQVLLEAVSLLDRNQFSRSRHIDLQRFFKDQFHINVSGRRAIDEIMRVLDQLEVFGDRWNRLLRSRAIAVSMIVLAWERIVRLRSASARDLTEFATLFVGDLLAKATAMRNLQGNVRSSQTYLIDFQRHVTQAAVERPALQQRHAILSAQLDYFMANGGLQP